VIVDRIRRNGFRHVLDVGCGTGQLAAYLLDHGIDSYFGIDFSAKAVEYARRNAPGGRFVVEDVRVSNVYDQVEHDVLVCTEVLEHVVEDLAVVGRFRPGTRCIFSVPSYSSEGHVRFFSDEAAVADRYGRYFGELEIVAFRIASTRAVEENRIFLAEGERNRVAPEA
jgi:2-polyprenyl-3-methyl-5-hydroxy-6-metoxy-1,4-benzoquinol methylase